MEIDERENVSRFLKKIASLGESLALPKTRRDRGRYDKWPSYHFFSLEKHLPAEETVVRVRRTLSRYDRLTRADPSRSRQSSRRDQNSDGREVSRSRREKRSDGGEATSGR